MKLRSQNKKKIWKKRKTKTEYGVLILS